MLYKSRIKKDSRNLEGLLTQTKKKTKKKRKNISFAKL